MGSIFFCAYAKPSPSSDVLARRGVELSEARAINGDEPREDKGDVTDENDIKGDEPRPWTGDPTDAKGIKGDEPRDENGVSGDGAHRLGTMGPSEAIPARPRGSRRAIGLLKAYRARL